ncbi:hypothetical protein T261_7792 [Streptomyces lydicus]|nr:hypothetical protein T261_7792 [Streptomyces lydicus]
MLRTAGSRRAFVLPVAGAAPGTGHARRSGTAGRAAQPTPETTRMYGHGSFLSCCAQARARRAAGACAAAGWWPHASGVRRVGRCAGGLGAATRCHDGGGFRRQDRCQGRQRRR